MKFNKFMIIGIILLAIISIGAVSATNETDETVGIIDDGTVDVSLENEEIQANDSVLESSVDEDEPLQSGNIVTSDNFFDYFDSSGSLKTNVNLTFQGEFNSPVEKITINRIITVNGADATFKNMGISVKNGATIDGLTLIADHSLGDLIKVESDNVILSNLKITYDVGDESSTAINVYDSNNVKIFNSKINFESHITSDQKQAIGINIEDSNDVLVSLNEINTVFPALSVNYDPSSSGMGLNYVNSVRIKTSGNVNFTNNKLNAKSNDFSQSFPTLQAMLVSQSTNSLIYNNNISMIDTLCPVGTSAYLYAVNFDGNVNLTISNNDIDVITKGGGVSAGAAYPINGASSIVNIVGNNLYSKSRGPGLGILLAGLGGDLAREILIDNNYINVTGLAATDPWALVSGIEVQLGYAVIKNNRIFTYNINSYSDDNYIFGISYAQWISGERSFDIQNNTVGTQGKYTVSIIATYDSESTPLNVVDNKLQANGLNSSASVYSKGTGLINIANNTDYPDWTNSSSSGNGSDSNSSGENDTYDLNIVVGSVWQGMDNTIKVIIPNATGSVEIKVNENKYNVDLFDGNATLTIPASALSVGENTVTANYNNVTNSTKFYVLNGVVTKDNIFAYVDKSNNYALYDYVPEGVTLDFQGQILATELGDFSINITKPVNIVSSTDNAYVDLNTVATDRTGKNPGNRFTISKNGSNTNVTGIVFHNTQMWLSNTHNVILDSISVIVENQQVGPGVGVTSIRENSSYITVKNSYFSTTNNEGSSTLVLAWANYCTLENNIIHAEGNVGNILYLNSYNVDIPSGALVNSYNSIINNTIYGPSTSSAICRAICYMGSNNLFEDNVVYYSGEGFMPADNGANFAGNSVVNNNFLGGASMTISKGFTVYNNNVTGKVTLLANTDIVDSEMGSLNVNGDNVTVDNCIINGAVSVSAVANSQIKNSVITGDVTINSNGDYNSITNNSINGLLTIKGSNNIISANHIISTGDYAVSITNSRAANNNITYNHIYAAVKYGDEAVEDKYKKNFISDNLPTNMSIIVSVDNIKVGQNAVVKIWINENSTGSVNVTFNGATYSVSMNKGYGEFTISDLQAGSYTVRVDFSGDGTFAPQTVNKTFTVSKYATSIENAVNVTVVNNTDAVFTLTLSGDYTGNMTVAVKDKTYGSSLVGGVATVRINNLSADNYNVAVRYSGDNKYESASTFVSFIIKTQTTLEITVNNIFVGEDAFVQVSGNKGLDGEVKIILNGEYRVAIVNGSASMSVSNLNAGNYTATVVFGGNDEFLPAEANTTFTVSKNDVSQDCLNMVMVDNSPKFSADLANDATGMLTVTINNQNYTSAVINGKATVSPSLAPGRYDAVMAYSGDGKYNPVSKSVDFIIKDNPNLSISVENIFVGDDEVISVTVNSNITSGVTVELNGQYTVVLVNGKGNVTVSNLAYGNYTAKAKFEGNAYFFADQTEAQFTVSKISLSEDSIVVVDNNYSININTDATGNLTVAIGDKKYTKAISNGKANITVDDLTPGNYDVVISYSGDDKYFGISKNATLTVPKYESTVMVSVADIDVGNIAKFNIEVPKDATGIVSVVFDFGSYNSTVSNGKAIVNVPDLEYGNYSVIVKYLGDKNYLKSQNTTELSVRKVVFPYQWLFVDLFDVYLSLDKDATGYLIIGNKSEQLNNGSAKITLDLTPGIYNLTAEYSGDRKYAALSEDFQLNISRYVSQVSVSVENISVGDVAVFNITVTSDATGIVNIISEFGNRSTNITDGKAIIKVPGLMSGDYHVIVSYEGDNQYYGSENNASFTVSKIKLSEDIFDMSSSKVTVNTFNDAGGKLVVMVDNEEYATRSVVDGAASVSITNLAYGNHVIKATYTGDDKYESVSKQITVNIPVPHVPVLKLTGSDLSMLYTSKTKYKVRLTSDGAGLSGKSVTFVVNGKKTSAKTDSKGYAYVSINLPPRSAKYSVSATYGNLKVTKKVKVNTIMSAKNMNVKKSAKSFNIKVTLKKVDGKYQKSKKITLKLNGKKYTAKTNAKGVATFKMTKKVINKLKAGKKYTYQATYLKDSVKKTIKVKK